MALANLLSPLLPAVVPSCALLQNSSAFLGNEAGIPHIPEPWALYCAGNRVGLAQGGSEPCCPQLCRVPALRAPNPVRFFVPALIQAGEATRMKSLRSITCDPLFQAVLPSYEEALELPSKDSPPPYVTI